MIRIDPARNEFVILSFLGYPGIAETMAPLERGKGNDDSFCSSRGYGNDTF